MADPVKGYYKGCVWSFFNIPWDSFDSPWFSIEKLIQIRLRTLNLSLFLGKGGSGTNFQLLILSLNLLKSKIPFVNRQGEGEGRPGYVRHQVRIWGELQNFDSKIFHQARSSASQIVSVRRLTSWGLTYHAGNLWISEPSLSMLENFKHNSDVQIYWYEFPQGCLGNWNNWPVATFFFLERVILPI